MDRRRALDQARACVLVAVLFLISTIAAYWVGFLLGWLTGASLSPVVSSVAPLVFGLLAALGIGVGLRRRLSRRSDVGRGIFVGTMVSVFCYGCFIGVSWGNMSRLDPYMPMDMLIGESWKDTDDETAARLHALRWKARRAQISHQDFEAFIVDVIKPIMDRNAPDEADQVARALEFIDGTISANNR